MISHVRRQDPNYNCNIAMTYTLERKGTREKPKYRSCIVGKDIKEAGRKSLCKVQIIAANQGRWKGFAKALLCTTRHWENS